MGGDKVVYTYLGLGFLVLCICVGIALILGFASITNYYVHLTEKKLEVSPKQPSETSNNPEQG